MRLTPWVSFFTRTCCLKLNRPLRLHLRSSSSSKDAKRDADSGEVVPFRWGVQTGEKKGREARKLCLVRVREDINHINVCCFLDKQAPSIASVLPSSLRLLRSAVFPQYTLRIHFSDTSGNFLAPETYNTDGRTSIYLP